MTVSVPRKWWLLPLGAFVLMAGFQLAELERTSRTPSSRSAIRRSDAARSPPSARLDLVATSTTLGRAAPSESSELTTHAHATRSAALPNLRDATHSALRPAWAERALCGDGSPKVSEWTGYLQAFRTTKVGRMMIHADPAVELRTLRATARSLELASEVVQQATELTTEAPDVYVHRDLATLRKYSCVAGNAVAFYDGALHLADVADDEELRVELWYSVVHEYTHHALFSHGIREPFWFQEALAMHVSHERWRGFDITPPGFDVRDMVDGFPHTASPNTAERFYGQAYQMLELIDGLCQSRTVCNYPSLVRELAAGAAPGTFFQDTIARLAPTSSAPPLELWQMYFSGLRPSQ